MIKEIYAIEISGECNLSCPYCPYHLPNRKRGLMDWETLFTTLRWIGSGKLKASDPLFLHLFGEPLLHPRFYEMAEEIKKTCPNISFSTNGTLINRGISDRLSIIGFDWITVSPHKPKVGKKAFYLLKSSGNEVRMHDGPDHDWAGQVENKAEWSDSCQFENKGRVVVRWNGDVASCCISDVQDGVISNVWDKNLLTKENGPTRLCYSCHLERSDLDVKTTEGRAVQEMSVSGGDVQSL